MEPTTRRDINFFEFRVEIAGFRSANAHQQRKACKPTLFEVLIPGFLHYYAKILNSSEKISLFEESLCPEIFNQLPC
jgi:hypothetical protein